MKKKDGRIISRKSIGLALFAAPGDSPLPALLPFSAKPGSFSEVPGGGRAVHGPAAWPGAKPSTSSR